MRRLIIAAGLSWLALASGAQAQNKQSGNFDTLIINGSVSGQIQLKAPPTAGNSSLTLPPGTGVLGQALTSDGAGGTLWGTVNSSAPTPSTPPLCPIAAPTITGTTYYVDSSVAGYNGSLAPSGACATADAAAGTSPATAWCTYARVKTKEPTLAPGDGVLFKGGDVWTEQFGMSSVLGTAANPIVFSSYGTGRPIIDAAANQYGIEACNTTCNDGGNTGNGSNQYVIINNIEIKHAKNQAITFQTNGGTPSNTAAGTPDSIHDITVQNSYIHNSGPGAPATGTGVGTSQTYDNQLDFESFSQGTDNTKVLCNTIQDVGGWNALEVHYDTGAVQVKGNIVGTGGHACGPHGCIDTKGIGSVFAPALVYGNTASCGLSLGLCPVSLPGFYVENTNSPKADITYQNNVSYDNGVSFQAAGGYSTCTNAPCAIQLQYYNDTAYNTSSSANAYSLYADDKSGNTNSAPLTLDLRNDILDGANENVGMVNASSACTFANYNNQGGSLGAGTKTGCLANAEANGQVNVNPQYVQASAGNFLLQGTSPDLNTGQAGLTAGNPHIGANGTGSTGGAVTASVSSCGAGAAVAATSTLANGSVTVGSTNPTTTCPITFSSACPNALVCTLSDLSTFQTLKPVQTNKSVMTITAATNMFSDVVNWNCGCN